MIDARSSLHHLGVGIDARRVAESITNAVRIVGAAEAGVGGMVGGDLLFETVSVRRLFGNDLTVIASNCRARKIGHWDFLFVIIQTSWELSEGNVGICICFLRSLRFGKVAFEVALDDDA